MALQRDEILRLLHALNEDLAREEIMGEVYIVGGAVMCLALAARPSTNDVDGYFKPTRAIRAAAKRVASLQAVADEWLNDAVKGYISANGDFDQFLELSNLRVMTASPSYLLAMKCLAMRLGAEFQDENDVRFLLRYLNIDDYDRALATITAYYPLERFPQKTLYALEELCSLTR